MALGIQKHQLSCCALCQITAQDWTPIEIIAQQITQLKEDTLKNWKEGNRESGERACFIITTPNERTLASNLITLGFRAIAQFNRRNGYPDGKLTMWFLSW